MKNTKETAPPPNINSKINRFVNERIEALEGKRNGREIAFIAGFSTANMLSMIKTGYAKVPLDKVAGLARALECDGRYLMRLAMEQYLPEGEDLDLVGTMVSDRELEIVQYIRQINPSDPGLNDRRKKALEAAFKDKEKADA